MRRTIVPIGGLLQALACAGCTLFGPQGLPADPLFANRKPIESQATAGPPVMRAHSEPTPAPNPYAPQ